MAIRWPITSMASMAVLWVLAQQVADDSNHGRKPRKFNQDCTICYSCR